MVHNVRTTYELSSSDNWRLYKFQFTPAILNFHRWFIYFLSAYVIFTITHAKFNEPCRACGKSWHCKLPRKNCISPDLALPPLFSMECHPMPIMFCDCLAVELNRTLSNTIEPNQPSIAPYFLWEFDWVRLPNPIIWLSLIGFDWTFTLVRLVTSGKHKDLALWNKMCKHDNLKQRKYKLIPVLILKDVGAQKWATINVELTFEVPKKMSSRTLKVRGNSLKRSKYQSRQEYLDIQEPKLTFYSLKLLTLSTTTRTMHDHEPSNMASNLTWCSLLNGRKTFPPIVNPL